MKKMYILNNLRSKIELTVTDDMIEEYIRHVAILEDHTVEAYKEKYKEEVASEDFKLGVQNYFILRKLAETANFFIPEPETEATEIPEAETQPVEEEETEPAEIVQEKANPEV